MTECAAFVDTCIFLHYPPLKDVDWCSLCASDTVRLVVCMPVIHQLDDKKSDPLYRSRAQRAIDEIDTISDGNGNVRAKVVLEVLPQEHRAEDYPSHLNPMVPDDQILLHAIKYRETYPALNTIVTSEDLGMRLKCKPLSLTVVCPKSQRLENPNDALTKKHNETKRQLEEYKSRAPDLSVVVMVGDEPSDTAILSLVKLDPPRFLDVEALRKRLAIVPPKHRPIDVFDYFPVPGETIARDVTTEIPNEEYRRYDRELEAYLTRCGQFNRDLKSWSDLMGMAIDIQFTLRNSGTAPSSNIDISLSFPKGVRLMTESELIEQVPIRPNPPTPLRSLLGRAVMSQRSPPTIPKPAHDTPESVGALEGTVSGFEISHRTNRDATNKVGKIKHGHVVELGSLAVVFDSVETKKSFHVDYTITSDELLRQKNGSLDIVLETPEEPAGT